MIRKRKRKSWFARAYVVGYRCATDNLSIEKNSKQKFKVIMPSLKYGYADPFPVIYNGKHYIFAEIMDKFTEHGCIGVCCIEEHSKFVKVIDEPFHMSYPNVFELDGTYYMIPETHEARDIRLYVSDDFPYKWKLKKILVSDQNVADFSFFIKGDIMYAIAWDNDRKSSHLYRVSLNNFETEELFPNREALIDMRPGGNFYTSNDKLIIPLQECSRCYGEYLRFVETKVFTDNNIEQKELFQLKSKDVKVDKLIIYDRLHTYNRVDDFEVIDLLIYQISPKQVWLKLTRQI